MNGRLLFLISLLLSLFNVATVVGALSQEPFYLIPVISPDGKTTATGECIGALITYSHIIAPAKCLDVGGKGASGVFIDFRATKTYPADKDLFPISDFTFSKNIQHDSKNNFALITLHVPFTAGNTLSIHPVNITIAGNATQTINYARKTASVEHGDGNSGSTAGYDGSSNLVSLNNIKFDKTACDWLIKASKGVMCY